jgi:acetylornithine deacetylase/succinyl-diaminopimelate desuccinylase-like protein
LSAAIRAEAIALLERLVAFDSESNKSNLPLIDFVEDWLRGRGVEVLRAPNRAGDKAAPARNGPPILSRCAPTTAAFLDAAPAT